MAERKGKDEERVPQVGRRPSRPGFLAAVAVLWVAAGVFALARLHASWRIAVGIVFIGVGLFYARAAATTVVRRSRDR